MADTDPNITIDISGNTASMATDYNTVGVGITGSHVQIVKIAWGDSSTSTRTSSSDPLPVSLSSNSDIVTVNVSGSTGLDNINTKLAGFLAVAGNTSGTSSVNITGSVYGVAGGTAIGVTGTVRVDENYPVKVVGHAGSSYYGFGGTAYYPVVVTGGRPLSYLTDSVQILNSTVGISGGRELAAGTDSVSIFGPGGSLYTNNVLYGGGSASPTAIGVSGDSLKVSITNATIGITANVTIGSVVGVTNGSEPPLRIQGYTGSSYDPITVKGEYGGAVNITATSPIDTSVTNTVTIDDADIVNALTLSSNPLIENLAKITTNTGNISSIKSDLSSGKVKATVTTIAPSTLVSGSRTLTGSSASSLASSGKLSNGVTVQNSSTSVSSIMVGGGNLVSSPNNGIELEPGENFYISIDDISKVFVRVAGTGTNNSALIRYIGS